MLNPPIVKVNQLVRSKEQITKRDYYNRTNRMIPKNSVGIVRYLIPFGGGYHKKNESNQFYYAVKFEHGTVSLSSSEFLKIE